MADTSDRTYQTGTATLLPVFHQTLAAPGPAPSAGQIARMRSHAPMGGPAIPSIARPVPPVSGSETMPRPASPTPAAGDLTIMSDTSPKSVVPFTASTDEPSGAMAGKVRFMTGNWYAAYSNNSGANWTYLDPATAFPPADGGFCCDQVAIYSESRDTLFWLLLYSPSGTTSADTGRLRIGVKRNTRAGLSAAGWTTYDILPANVGGPATGEWIDYPQMALSDDFLYVSGNVYSTVKGVGWTRSVVVRIPLDSLSAGGTVTPRYFSTSANFQATLVQGAKDVMYWATHVNNTTLRIFKWEEKKSVAVSTDRTIPAWTQGSPLCPTGDGQDWCGKSDNRVLTGVLQWNQLTRQGELVWAWNAKEGAGFGKPYANAARFKESDLSYVDRPYLWQDDAPYMFPAMAANARGDIGMSIAYGYAPDNKPSSVVCILDEFSLDQNNWNCLAPAVGTDSPDSNRWGDFLTARVAYPADNLWYALNFTQQGGKDGAHAVPRAYVFGRARDVMQFKRWQDK